MQRLYRRYPRVAAAWEAISPRGLGLHFSSIKIMIKNGRAAQKNSLINGTSYGPHIIPPETRIMHGNEPMEASIAKLRLRARRHPSR